MSGLLGGFDGVMEGLTPDDVERLESAAEPSPDATPVVPEPAATPGPTPVVDTRRPIDPRAQAVADALLGRHTPTTEPITARLHAAVGSASVECPPAATVVIGRAAGELRVPLGVVSRRHCAVARDGARYTVVDLGSANGTLVCRPGGSVLQVGTVPVELQPGDVIATARGRRPIARLEASRSAG